MVLDEIDTCITITLYNVCSVHREMFSTLGGYHDACGGIP